MMFSYFLLITLVQIDTRDKIHHFKAPNEKKNRMAAKILTDLRTCPSKFGGFWSALGQLCQGLNIGY